MSTMSERVAARPGGAPGFRCQSSEGRLACALQL